MVERGEKWIVYGAHGSKGREWWGTIVVGGLGGDVCGGWRGWLRVDREQRGGFGRIVSAEEALLERDRGEGEPATWVVSSEWGGFRFNEEELSRVEVLRQDVGEGESDGDGVGRVTESAGSGIDY